MSENMEPDDDRTESHVVLAEGTMVSHYRIIEKIGAGGMGEVYLALDTRLNRKVALKFLPSHLCQDEDCRKRFMREAQATAKLSHPNIIHVYEVSEYHGRPFFAMEHVEGRSLREIKPEELDIDRIIGIAIQLCDGLQTAHAAGVTHRDIKPSNIVIDTAGRPRLLDFGLATVKGGEHLTKTGSTLGTIGYMSPEQVRGQTIDHRSDLFSLGIVLYELITGHSPFRRDNETAILRAITNDSVEPLARYKRDVSQLLESIVGKLLEKDPSYRYQRADGVISDLKRIGRPTTGTGETKRHSGAPWKRPQVVFPVMIAVVVAVMLLLRPSLFNVGGGSEVIASENRLAIMYFENLNDPADKQRLGEIVTNLLITDLSESRYMSIVSSQRLYDILKQLGHEGEKRVDRGVATKVGQVARARYMLLGSILNTEPDIVITSQLVETATGDALASQRIEGQPGERIFAVVDRLTRAVKEDLSLPVASDAEIDPDVADMTTNSPEAYRKFLEGEELFIQHFWNDARVAFMAAVEIDSTFALAHFRLALLDYWRNDPRTHTHLANALRYVDALSHRDRMYLNSLDARLKKDIPRSVAILKGIIEEDPQDKDAYVSLGLLLKYETHQLREAIPYFERAIELDPYFREAYNQLAYLNNALGRFDEAMWAINKYIEIAPDEANAYDSKGEILAMNGRLDDAILAYEQATRIEPDFSRLPLADLYMYKGDLEAADSIFHEIASDPRKLTRAAGRLALTRLPRYQGRFKEALRLLEVGIATDELELGRSPQVAEKKFKRALINDFLGNDDSVIEDLREAIAIVQESDPRGLYTGPYQFFMTSRLRAVGQESLADSLMSEIKSAMDNAANPDSTFYWIATAMSLFELHQYEDAARLWEKLIKPEPHHFPSLVFLGVSYLEVGRLGDAVSTLERAVAMLAETRGGDAGMGVTSIYHLARAYEASGWIDRAVIQYTRFLEIWKNADSGIAEIEDAKKRLARIKSL